MCRVLACVNCKTLCHIVCVCVCAHVSVCVCGSLHCMNEIVALLNLSWFIYNFYTWLIVMFCVFVNELYEWNATKTNFCVHWQIHVHWQINILVLLLFLLLNWDLVVTVNKVRGRSTKMLITVFWPRCLHWLEYIFCFVFVLNASLSLTLVFSDRQNPTSSWRKMYTHEYLFTKPLIAYVMISDVLKRKLNN